MFTHSVGRRVLIIQGKIVRQVSEAILGEDKTLINFSISLSFHLNRKSMKESVICIPISTDRLFGLQKIEIDF